MSFLITINSNFSLQPYCPHTSPPSVCTLVLSSIFIIFNLTLPLPLSAPQFSLQSSLSSSSRHLKEITEPDTDYTVNTQPKSLKHNTGKKNGIFHSFSPIPTPTLPFLRVLWSPSNFSFRKTPNFKAKSY
jgi:hypothetical protein